MALTTPEPEFTQANLDAIDAAITSGAKEVRYQDRTVVYRSQQELLTLRTLIWNNINQNAPVIRQSRGFTNKGW